VFGAYSDELLLPQLKELRASYGVDGIWIDGDCWAACQDYSPNVIQSFRMKTGIEKIPVSPDEEGFFEYTEFCREGFRQYLRHYVDELHKFDPNFEIASNWAFSSFMPEPVTANVDFLSGDFTLQNSVNSARLEARCLMHQGKPWDLMAWGFGGLFGGESGNHDFTTKTAVQLKQEASVVLALGGGFQVYYQQKRDGSVRLWEMDIMAEVAAFCRERQPWCHQGESVAQIALLYSGSAFYRANSRLFGAWGGDLIRMRGVLEALLDGGQTVDIQMEHQLRGRMSEYPLIVFPEWQTIESDLYEELLAYVNEGGKLIVIGTEAVKFFADVLGVRMKENTESAKCYLSYKKMLAGMMTKWKEVEPCFGTRVFGELCRDNEYHKDASPAATIVNYGKGSIAGVYFDFGERYLNGCTVTARSFLQDLALELFPEPIVSISGNSNVDITVMRKNDNLLIHLVNTSGPHADAKVFTYDEVPQIGSLEVVVRSCSMPNKVLLQPEGTVIAYTYQGGELRLSLPRLELYSIVEICKEKSICESSSRVP